MSPGDGPRRASDTGLQLTVSAMARAGLGTVAEIEAMPFADVLRYNVTLHHQADQERAAIQKAKRR